MKNVNKLVDKIHEIVIKQGMMVHPVHTAYAFYRTEIYGDAQAVEYKTKHFSNRNGYVLSLRCIENYFGSLIDESDLNGVKID